MAMRKRAKKPKTVTVPVRADFWACERKGCYFVFEGVRGAPCPMCGGRKTFPFLTKGAPIVFKA
jgi:hypothetical protein